MSRAMDRIMVVDIPAGIGAEMLVEGELYLDLEEGFSFDVTEKASELSDVNELKESGVLGFSVPMDSPKNQIIFGKYMGPNVLNQTFAPLEVRCIGGGSKVLRWTLLFFKGSTDSDKRIEVELIDAETYWVKRAQEVALADLEEVGEYTVTESFLRNDWESYGMKFFEAFGNYMAYPLLHRGGWLRGDNFDFGGVQADDFFPVYSVPGLLKLGFKKIGYEVVGPLFEWDDFMRWWTWIGEPEVDYDGKGEFFSYKGETSADMITIGYLSSGANPIFLFDNEIQDLNDSHHVEPNPVTQVDSSRYLNTTNSFSKFVAVIEGTVTNSNAFRVRFNMNVSSWNQNNVLDNVNAIDVEANTTTSYRVELEFSLGIGEEAFFFPSGITDLGGGSGVWQISFDTGTSIEVRPASDRVYRNDVLMGNQLINEDYNFLEFVKGVVHTFAGKIYTDHVEGKVYMYPPEEVEVPGVGGNPPFVIEGYLKGPEEDIDVTENVVPESKKVIPPEEVTNRYLRIKWKDSECAYIQDVLKIDKEKGLWSRDVDLGVGSEKEVKKLENPFFEPTGNITWNRMELPALWDNTDGRISTKIGPRLLYGVGYIYMNDSENQDNYVGWEFDFSDEIRIPWATQSPTHPFSYSEGGDVVVPDRGIVYGSDDDLLYDLYRLFWQFEVRLMLSTVTFEFLISVDQRLFNRMTFRERLFFIYGGKPYLVRLLEKRSFLTSKDVPMTILVRPGVRFLGDIVSKGVRGLQDFEKINVL